MQQFYSVLVQQIARVDASDDRQRQAVYDRARLNLARLTGNAEPDIGRTQSTALEQAIARLESEIGQIQAGNAARSERESLLNEVRKANPELVEARLSELNLPEPKADTPIETRPVQDLLPDNPFANPDPMGIQAARDKIEALRREIAGEDEPEPEPPAPPPAEDGLRFEGGRWERTKSSERGPADDSAFPTAPAMHVTGPDQADLFVPPGEIDTAGLSLEQAPDVPFVPPGAPYRENRQPAESRGGDSRNQAQRRQSRRPDEANAALPVTQTRLPPRLGRDPQHLLRAKSIGSPTVFALLGASGAVALIGLIALVVALDPATGGVGADPGQRPIVLFSPTRPTQFQVPRGNSYLRIPGDDGGVHLSSRIADVSTGPNSAAIAVQIAPVATDVLQGNRAEVQIEARQIGDRPSQSFAVAYRTSTGPNSGWFEFQPTPEFNAYSFSYTVPVAQRDDIIHDLLIWADTAAQGGTIEVRSITITMGG